MTPQPKPILCKDFKLPQSTRRKMALARPLGISRSGHQAPIQNTVRTGGICGPKEMALYSGTTRLKQGTFYKASQPDHADLAANSPDRYCFAPLEEQVHILVSHLHPELIKETKFELYCRVDNQLLKLWTKTFTWRVCPSAYSTPFHGSLGPCDEAAEKLKYPDLTSVKVVTNDAILPTEFPDGCVTVARSPYMLRYSVVPRLPATTLSEFAIWSYFDVLAHSISLEWGAPAMIPGTKRDDIENSFHAETVLREKTITFAGLTTAQPDPMAPTHEVILDSDHLGGAEVAAVLKVQATQLSRRGTGVVADVILEHAMTAKVDFPSGTPLEAQEGKRSYKTAGAVSFQPGETGPVTVEIALSEEKCARNVQPPKQVVVKASVDFDAYLAIWGNGPRIPILAKIRVKRSDKSGSTTDDALKAVGAAECLWDWEDNADTKIRDWMGAADADSTALSRHFLTETMKGEPGDVDAAPLGSLNCPVKFGGKRGVNAKAVFLEAEQGAYPYPVTAAAGNRPWAAFSKCGTGDKAGRTGVLFQPSRMTGDRYRLVVYLATNRTDFDVKDIAPDQSLRQQVMALPVDERPAMAVSGLFEVFRRVKVNYYSFPLHTAGSEKINDAKTSYKKVAGTIIDVVDKGAPPASLSQNVHFQKAFKDLYEGDGDVQFFIHHLFVQPQPPPDGQHFLHTRNPTEHTTEAKNHFKQQPIFAVTLTDGAPFVRSGGGGGDRFVEVKSGGGVEGFVVMKDHRMSAELNQPVYLLLSKSGGTFQSGDTLSTVETSPKETKIKKVLTEASGFVDLAVKLAIGATERIIDVDIAGVAVQLQFAKKAFSGKISKQLTTDHKRRLRTAVIQQVNGRQTQLTIRIAGKMDDDRGALRMSRVRGYILSLFLDRTVVDRADVYGSFKETERSYHDPEMFETQAKRRVEGVFSALLTRYAKEEIQNEKGVYFFYFENISKASYFVEGAASAPLGTPTMIPAMAVMPRPPHLTPLQQFLGAKELLIHELGHCFFLNHNYARMFEPGPPAGTFMTTEVPEHVEHDTCLMNYDPDPPSQQFCGKCVLRLRGWKNSNMSNKVDHSLATTLIKQDVAAAGANACWPKMRLAHHLANSEDVKNAIKKASSKREVWKHNRLKVEKEKEPWKGYIVRRKELQSIENDDRSKKQWAEIQDLERRESAIERVFAAPLDAINEVGTILNNEVRVAGRELVITAEAAWDLFSQNNVIGPGLGVNMLRNMALIHAKFGDAEKARDYYRQLESIASHGLDLTGGNPLKDIYFNSPRHQVDYLNNIDTDYYEVTVEIGDMDDIFADAASTAKGQKARLQVLGLFARPLDHPESDDCLTFSWKHAKTLFNGLADGDPTKMLDKEIAKFLVSTGDGKVPLAGAPAGRIRCAAGFGPLYSQTAMMLQFPEWDYPRKDGYQEGMHEDEKPYSKYMLGGDPYEVEDAFFDANPALGKIPLKIKVRKRPVSSDADTDYRPAAKARLYVQLVEPDSVDSGTFASGTGSSNPVAGGTSYSKGAEPPALAGKPAAYLKSIDDRVNLTNPAAPGDPQGFNKSAHVGGKRQLMPDGNITDPNDQLKSSTGKTRENLLLSPAGGGVLETFPVLPDSKRTDEDKPLPHTITLDLDDAGEAKIVFAPSRVGGDRYKFRFYVGKPTMTTRNDSNPTETSTLVVWRTARISRYLKMPAHTGAGDMPAYLQGQMAQAGAPPYVKAAPAPLTDIDFSAEMTKELAKAYMELVVEPKAVASEGLAGQSQNFRDYVLEMQTQHPWFVNCTFAQRFFKVTRNNEGKPIDPKDGRVLGEGELFFGSYQYANSACALKELVPGTGKTGTGTTTTATLRWTPFATSLRLVENNAGETGKAFAECAIDTPAAMTGTIDLKVISPLASATFDYTSRQLTLTFETAAAAQSSYEIYYQGKDFADLDALILDFPAASPYLFNLRLPADYNQVTNQKNGTKYPPMIKADQVDFFGNRPYPHVGYFDDRAGGLVKTVLMEALGRSVDDNGGFYPGIILVQAVELDNWGAPAMQDGKAVGRTVYLFNNKAPQAVPDVKVLLHEMAHGLFLQHAPSAPGMQKHLHDETDGCVMNYGTPANDGDFCGQCVAALRGMNAGDEPFVKSD